MKCCGGDSLLKEALLALVILEGPSIWVQVGVDAAPEDVLDHLIKLDTATAFNISEGDVYVSSVTQLSRRVLYVNVTATLGVDVPPGASSDDVTEALDLKNLSADEAIGLLSENPDKFLGRTTKVCMQACQKAEAIWG